MEQTQRSAEYIFQGTMFFYRAIKVQCRYQIVLRDAVEPDLLQQALDAALADAPYFRVRLVWEKDNAFLEPNPAPCRIRRGSAQPVLPDAEDDYLFCVSWEDQTIFMDWDHFLADGHGMVRFITLILKGYCNLRYGTRFPCEPLVSSPAYDIAALCALYPYTGSAENLKNEIMQTFEEEPQGILLRLEKQSLVRQAVARGAKPFSTLMALLGEASGRYLDKKAVRYTYSVDVRNIMGVPDALYNCVASYLGEMPLGEDYGTLDSVLPSLNASILTSLEPEQLRRQMAVFMGWVYKVSQQKAPLRIKRRIYQMGEYVSGGPSDFWISYLGHPLGEDGPMLEPYLQDLRVDVPADGASIGVEAFSMGGVITLCIKNKVGQPGFAQTLCSVLEQEGIRVLEVQEQELAPVCATV